MKNDYVWYLSYGSNININRFMYYINGGLCEYNNRNHMGCNDKSKPIRIKSIIIDYEMYFAKSSSSWGKGGVCFIKTEPKKNIKTYARMFLITYEQFLDIWEQEGKVWYDKKIEMGTLDNYKIYTFTSSKEIFPKKKPSDIYKEVIIEGLKEAYPELSNQNIINYLNK